MWLILGVTGHYLSQIILRYETIMINCEMNRSICHDSIPVNLRSTSEGNSRAYYYAHPIHIRLPHWSKPGVVTTYTCLPH